MARLLGTYFDGLTGIKQGGVISPRIYNSYMDDLIDRLRKCGIGCHIIDIFIIYCVSFLRE